MATFVNPRAADHAEGLEQRIIELGRRIDTLERASAHARAEVEELKDERTRLLDELAHTSQSLQAEGAGTTPSVDADRVSAA